MRRLVLAVVVTTAFMVVGRAADAHHSFAAMYDESQQVSVEGSLVQIQFRNPHTFMQLDIKGKDGKTERYAAEWSGVLQLGNQGVNRETFKPGDILIITGNPSRNPADHRIRLVVVRRPSDGFEWGRRTGEVVN